MNVASQAAIVYREALPSLTVFVTTLACGSSAHVHGQPRSRQFRVKGLEFRVWV